MLVDAHVHVALNGAFTKRSWLESGAERREAWIREIFGQYKSKGVTALRDGGDGYFVSELAREIAGSEGITYKSPIYAIYKRGRYGSFLGRPVDDKQGFKKEFKCLVKHKPDHLKVILTGIVSFQSYGDVGGTAFSVEELRYMVGSARDRGMSVMVHANGAEGVRTAVRASVDTIEHGYLMTEAELYGIAEKGIVWVPTLAPLGNILALKESRFENDRQVIQKVYAGQTQNIKRALELGVKVALGSDAGAYAVGHGSGLLDEIGYFKKLGIAEDEVKRMCSENGARALGI